MYDEDRLGSGRQSNNYRLFDGRNDFGNSNNNFNSESENNVYDLIDINFTNVSKDVKNENDKCVICYDNFKKNESVKMTVCFHLFHFNCIKKWIESKEDLDEIPDCPICRRGLWTTVYVLNFLYMQWAIKIIVYNIIFNGLFNQDRLE